MKLDSSLAKYPAAFNLLKYSVDVIKTLKHQFIGLKMQKKFHLYTIAVFEIQGLNPSPKKCRGNLRKLWFASAMPIDHYKATHNTSESILSYIVFWQPLPSSIFKIHFQFYLLKILYKLLKDDPNLFYNIFYLIPRRPFVTINQVMK